jgi:hypothetical protein
MRSPSLRGLYYHDAVHPWDIPRKDQAMTQKASTALLLSVLLLAACSPPGDDSATETLPDDTSPGDTQAPPVEEDPLEVGEASVQASEDITLVAIVSWTSNVEATPSVRIGQDGVFTHEVGYGHVGTEHEVIVVGMRPEQAYELQPVTTTAGGQRVVGEALDFTTGAVPDPWRPMNIDLYDASRAFDGWTLYNIATSFTTPAFSVMVDMAGEPVWYYHAGNGGRSDLVPKLVDGERVLIGPGVPSGARPLVVDLAGRVLWEGPTQDLGFTDGGMHHVFEELENGDYLLVEYTANLNGDMGDTLLQYDQDAELVWEWSTFDHLDDHPAWVHTNSVFLNEPAGLIYTNSYQMGMTFEIDKASGEVLWSFGEGGDFSPDPYAIEPYPNHAHAFQILEGGNMLIYDNGDEERGYSRVVEFSLDEDSMSSEIVWQYPGTLAYDPWWCAAWGDVQRLPNGNTLINAGAGTNTPEETVSRIFEVTPEGDTVWRAWLHQDEELELGAYSAERYEPLAKPISEED